MRLFVAVTIPSATRHAIRDAVAPLEALGMPLQWVAEENLHVTLRFLGAVPDKDTGPIGDALAAAVRGARPFDVTMGGVGGFPDLALPRAVWIGVERLPALELLANDVAVALSGFGFEPELRPFHPHVTIARSRRNAGRRGLAPLDAAARAVDYSGLLAVEGVDVMASRIGRGGSQYRSLKHCPLEGG